MNMKKIIVVCLLSLVALWIGFLANQRQVLADDSKEPKLAHNVYFSLNDNSDAATEKLVAACEKYLSGHSGSESFAIGRLAKDLKQPVNDQEFDVSIQFVFTNKAAFEKYSKSEKHLKFIEENKANWKKVRVFDSYLEP
jgi:hypothetical protein